MPNTVSKLLRRYGTPQPTVAWESKNLVLWDVPADINRELPALPNKIYCNKDIVAPLELVFRDLIRAFHARELSTLDSIITWDGCFNIRKKRGLTTMSTHAWGLAVDLNAFRNQLGTEGTFSEAFGRIWEKHGFIWGKRWNRMDPMHMEFDTDLLPALAQPKPKLQYV